MVSFVKRKAFGIGTTLVVVGGLLFVLQKTDAGTKIIDAAKGAGETLAKLITGVPEGFLKGIGEGGGDLFVAGADIQEQVTGNRSAIGDFFGNLFGGGDPIPQAFGEIPGVNPNQPEPTVNNPGIRNVSSGFDFSGILKKLNLVTNETFTFNQPQTIGTRRNVGLSLTGARGMVNVANASGVRGQVLSSSAIGRNQPTLQGTITTAAGGTRSVSGSSALFERLQRNLN